MGISLNEIKEHYNKVVQELWESEDKYIDFVKFLLWKEEQRGISNERVWGGWQIESNNQEFALKLKERIEKEQQKARELVEKLKQEKQYFVGLKGCTTEGITIYAFPYELIDNNYCFTDAKGTLTTIPKENVLYIKQAANKYSRL